MNKGKTMRLEVSSIVIVLAVLLAACGEEPGASETTTTIDAVETTTSVSPTSTTTDAATTTSESPTTTAMRGEPVDMGPPAGATLGVIGVAHNDVLNLRANPGADQPIVAEIPPTHDEIVALGETRSLPAFWTKVSYEGTEGWVNMRYLAYIGDTSDTTAEVVANFGERPEAATMTELGIIVAEAMASVDPPSEIVIVVKESIGDLGEVTLDVVGLGDDSVRGVRLHIFAEILDGHFQLRTVEHTVLCDPTRGVDDDGVCA
jgi:hypothetical protein